MPAQRVVETVCGYCHLNCGLEVLVKDGTIDKVRGNKNHPVNRGALCRKASAAKQMVYSNERLTHPLARTSGGFKRISWEEALDRIADKLASIRDQHGPESLVRYSGAPVTEENRDAFIQFLASYGSPNYGNPGHLCSVPRRLALKLVYGARTDPDYADTKCIIVWGSNPTESMRPAETTAYGRTDRVIQAAQKAGARLIVIDPRRTEIADAADEYVRINPGTDAALGLAMLNVILEEGLYDTDFVDKWTLGFPQLREHVRGLTPEWAAGKTGIGADRIASLARTYASAKPAVIREGNGLDQHANVVDTVRITGILTAVTGNLDVPGGNVFFPMPPVARCPVSDPGGVRLGSERHPLFPMAPFPSVVDSLITGEPYLPRAMIVYHGNPLLVNANEARVRRALERLEFLVVYDIFMTATAELADIVLPDTSDFERYGYQSYSSREGGIVALRQKAIDPVGESRPVFEVEHELAKRLGFGDAYPWASNEGWVDFKMKPLGITLEDLKRQPIRVVTPPLEYRKYMKKGFDTPSGKVELFAGDLRKFGYEPIPSHREPAAQPSPEFPLIGTTRRPGVFVHTRFRNLSRLREIEPEPVVRVSPADAGARGIRDGSRVHVRSPRGRIEVKATVSDEVGPGFLVIDFGWGNPGDGGANVNVLTNDDERDPYSSTTPNRRFACQLEVE